MLRHLLGFVVFLLFACMGNGAHAAAFEVTNIKVSIQSEDAVKARDQAINQAQRIGFATMTNKSPSDISTITDAQIARLVRGFSLQGERVASRSYAATFTIRFNPGATQNFAAANGLSVSPLAQQGSVAAVNVPAKTVVAEQKPAQASEETAPTEATIEEAPVNNNVVVLPVLDIGTRQTLWDEPNPWRDTWQKQENTLAGAPIAVPIGDIDDVSAVPDASFLNGGQADFKTLSDRYKAGKLYVVVAKNQGNGMLLSLYTFDGEKLALANKQVTRPRPGFLFDDAVPAAIHMMAGAGNTTEITTTTTTETQVTQTTTTAPISGSVIVTVPYQSLPQWVGIQKRLRLVNGVRNVVPVRMSPSSAQVKVSTNNANFEELQNNMAQQGFDIHRMPDGELALTEK